MASGVTEQALARLSHLPGSDNPADMIAGQQYFNVEFTGGTISGVAITNLDSPIAIADGGTGQITATAALTALLPDQTGNSGKALKTNGTVASWGTDTDTGITQLTGDVTAGPGSGSQAATLATVNSNVGTFGSSTAIPVITANGKGLGTAYSTAAVIAPAGTLTGATLASGVTASSLTSVGTLVNLTVTNPITGSVTGNAATVTTNANLTGAITSVGNATSLGSFTSANLKTALTDETGSGAAVFANTPTLVTPVLGAASATSINFGGTSLSTYTEGTWTPADNSGAALSLTATGSYTRIGRMVYAEYNITYPSTASGNNASISGLPFAVSGTGGAASAFQTIDNRIQGNNGATTFNLYNATGSNLTNTNMSTKVIQGVFIYHV